MDKVRSCLVLFGGQWRFVCLLFFFLNLNIFARTVVRPVLGISYLESKQAKALGIQNGVLVLDVPEGSPAYRAGLRGTRRTESGLIELGDIISKVGDTVINTEADLFRALENLKPGDRVKVRVSRVGVTPETNAVTLETIELDIPLQSSTIFEKNIGTPRRVIPSPSIPQSAEPNALQTPSIPGPVVPQEQLKLE